MEDLLYIIISRIILKEKNLQILLFRGEFIL